MRERKEVEAWKYVGFVYVISNVLGYLSSDVKISSEVLIGPVRLFKKALNIVQIGGPLCEKTKSRAMKMSGLILFTSINSMHQAM